MSHWAYILPFQFFAVLVSTAALADSPFPEPANQPHYNGFGGVGLIETRSARMAAHGTLAGNVTYSPSLQRYGITFQATPWLEATFNYQIFDFAETNEERFDRQFDIKVRLWEEDIYLPEVAVGFQDFLGTGIFGGEYVVASKAFGPLDLSLGLGWGRLGSRGELTNPLTYIGERFDQREVRDGVGGEVNFGQYFQGDDAGLFGGVIYRTQLDGVSLIAEYDSDNKEPLRGFESKIPLNFGLSYMPFDGIQLRGSILQGTEFQLAATLGTDVSKPLQDAPKEFDVKPFSVRDGRGIDPKIQKVLPPRGPGTVSSISGGAKPLADAFAGELRAQGLSLRRLVLGEETLQISIENKRFHSMPKAVGRAARILTRLAPEYIEKFRIITVEKGMNTAEFDVDREWLEFSARQRGYTASPPPLLDSFHTSDIGVLEGDVVDLGEFPRIAWSLTPDVRVSTFDPDNPLRFNIDAVAQASIEIFDGAFLSGSVRADLFGNFDEIDRPSDSVLPRVRSEFNRYFQDTDVGIERLSADYYFKPSDTTFAKVSAGLLESSFGGIGGQILWRPENAPVAYGAELTYVRQRDFDTLLNFRDYDTITGHLSAYLDTDFYDVDLAVHVGRYLAGDLGATLEMSRRFSNGWEIGAFATFTDVPFEDFGEGSFDKGLIFRVPFNWGLPFETRSTADITLRPVQRDGGQRLDLGDRLFRLTQPSSRQEVSGQWNDFSN